MFQYNSSPPFSGRIQEILSSVRRLKPLPTTSQAILKIVENPEATAQQVIDVIKTDQALAADVISMANSAAMGYRVTCSSIETAVVRLGFKRVRSLALKSFSNGPLSRRLMGYKLEKGVLWEHSLITARYSDLIARIISYPDPEDAYTAGLLHDMGKLMLDQYILEDYQIILDLTQKKNKHLWEIEEELFGLDHAMIGGLMAEKWNLPPNLVDGIRFHHMPSLSSAHRKLVAIVNIANALTPAIGDGLTHLEGRFIGDGVFQILGLNEDSFQVLKRRMFEAIEQEKRMEEIRNGGERAARADAG